MKRHLKILEYALSSLLRRKYKNFALVLVFSVIIGILSSVLFLTHSLKIEALNVLAESPQLIVQKLAGGRHELIDEKYMEIIGLIPGVGKITSRYWGYYYDFLTGGNYTFLGAGEEVEELELLEGEMLVEEGECVIGQGVAKAREMKVGEDLILTDGRGEYYSLTVTGIFKSNSQLLTNDLIVLDYRDLIDIFEIEKGKATDLIVEVFNESETSLVAQKIKALLPDTRPIMKSEIIRTYNTVFNWRSGMVLTMFAGAVIAFCILSWDKATGLSAEEKREIGILKAIGWETSDILELKFWEGAVISVTSFLTGILLGYLHIFFFGASFLAPALKGWSVVFPSFNPIPYLNPYHLFILLFLTVLPYVVSTVVPSWKVAVTDPDTIMRG